MEETDSGTRWVPPFDFLLGRAATFAHKVPEHDDQWASSWSPSGFGWDQDRAPEVPAADIAHVQEQEPSLPPHPLSHTGGEHPGNNSHHRPKASPNPCSCSHISQQRAELQD